MYIKQVDNKNFNPILYLPIPLGFLLLIIFNYISTKDAEVDKMMHQMIATFGVNVTFIALVGPLALACLLLLLWVKVVHQQSITCLTTSRPKIDWSRVFLSFSVWAGITIVSVVGMYLAFPENFEFNFNPQAFFPFLIIAIALVPLQTSFEEYLFRGYLMQGIGVMTKSKVFPLVLTSVVFGLMHIANPEVGKLGMTIMIYYIGTGFFLGIMTLMDEGLELALGFHAANNLIGALLITSDWSAFQTHSIFKDVSEPSAGFDIIMPVLVFFPLLLILFSKVYHWNNWKEKLLGKV
jgi:membrane protease YdiL (CAAX protease family)